MQSETPPPPWLWRVVRLGLGSVLMGGLLLSLVIQAGWNDSRPAAVPDDHFPDTIVHVTPPALQRVILLDREAGFVTLEAIATPLGSDPWLEYGLVFGTQGADQYTVFALGTDGYLSVFQVVGREKTPLLAWQQFPHVRRGQESNQLRFSCVREDCLFWVNDEYVVSLPNNFKTVGEVGLWVRRFAGHQAGVAFSRIAMWKENDLPAQNTR